MSVSHRSRLPDRLPIVFGLLLLCLGILAIHFFSKALARDLVEDRLAQRTGTLLAERGAAAREEIDTVRRFFSLLTVSPLIDTLIESASESVPGTAGSAPAAIRDVGDWLVGLLDYTPAIEQVRIVTTENTELLRVVRDGGVARVVRGGPAPRSARSDDVDELSRRLAQDPVASAISLSMERREADDPPRMVFRSAAPLYRRNGEPFGLAVAIHSARKTLFAREFALDPGLEYHVLDSQGRWLARADGTTPLTWLSDARGRWADRYGAAPAAGSTTSEGLQRYRGPEGDVLVAGTSLQLGDEAAVTLDLRLVTESAWLDDELASLYGRLATPAYLLLGLLVLTWLFLWHGPGRGKRRVRASDNGTDILEHSLTGILVTAIDGTVVSCNHAGREILGFDEDELPGINLYGMAEVTNGEATTLDAPTLDRLAASGSQGTELALTVRGRAHRLRMSVAKMARPGERAHFVLNFTDASGLRASFERLEARNEELHRQARERAAELEAAKELAVSAHEIRSEFIANVSHELRTPLHGIAGTLRLLRQDPLNERQQYNLMLAEESVSELTTVVNSIIDVSKLDADRLTIEETDISLLALVHDAAHRFAPRASEKQLSFVIDDIDLGDELVLGDGDRITRIINIILENAVKYTEKGSVRARFASSLLDDEEVLFECTVSDTGRGISAQQRARLFEPFHGSTPEAASSATGSGVGLGLLIAKQLCNLMYGDLDIDSTPGEGTECTFRIRLPLSDQQPPGDDPFRPLAGKQVALVQREELTRTAIRRLLESRGASVIDVQGIFQIDDGCWKDIAFLVLDLEDYDKDAEFIADQADRGADGVAIAVLATAVDTIATTERGRQLPDHVSLLPLPATTVGLEAALLAISGEDARHRDNYFDPLADTSHDVWNVLPTIRALVVDDNQVNQHVVGGLLEEYGASVAYANNGQEVLDLLVRKADRAFDVVFMDCQMPVMDGYEASRRIRAGAAGEAYIDIPIIAVTAAALGGDRMKCLDSGMTDYLVKPVKPNALERAVLRHVQRSEAVAASAPGEDGAEEDTEESVRDSLRAQLRRREDWNREAFKQRVMGNMEIVQTISELYLQNAPKLIDGIARGLDEEDYRDLRNTAHELSGMSENLGGEKMALIAREVELAALDRRSGDLHFLVGELQTHYERLRAVLNG